MGFLYLVTSFVKEIREGMAGDRSDACTGVGTWKQHIQTSKVHFINS